MRKLAYHIPPFTVMVAEKVEREGERVRWVETKGDTYRAQRLARQLRGTTNGQAATVVRANDIEEENVVPAL